MWIELHQSVWTHRKTFDLADRLDLDETYAAAHVIRLWTWAIDNAKEGDLSTMSDRAIAKGSGWMGTPDKFVEALIGAGWVDDDRQIRNWHDYAGKLIARWKDDADRKHRTRCKVVDCPNPAHGASGGRPPDRTGTDDGQDADDPGTSGVPYLTVPDLTGPQMTTSSAIAAGAAGGNRKAPSSKPRLLDMSEGAQTVLEADRKARGKRQPRQIGPALLDDLEQAVLDLGVDRLIDGVQWAAKNEVDELIKAIRAARTKRDSEEGKQTNRALLKVGTLASKNGSLKDAPAPPSGATYFELDDDDE